MIVRLVHMHFRQDAIEEFKALFAKQKEHIRKSDGCLYLELIQDIAHPQSFYTYSHWRDQESLNKYRHGALFSEVWPATKRLFDQPPTATSLHALHQLP